jgi:hypothetical protein
VSARVRVKLDEISHFAYLSLNFEEGGKHEEGDEDDEEGRSLRSFVRMDARMEGIRSGRKPDRWVSESTSRMGMIAYWGCVEPGLVRADVGLCCIEGCMLGQGCRTRSECPCRFCFGPDGVHSQVGRAGGPVYRAAEIV